MTGREAEGAGAARAAVPEFDPGRAARKRAAGDRPWVTLKAAATLDGKIAMRSGESRWITGPQAREAAHALRALHDGVMVGARTALADDPRLTVHLPGTGAAPARIVLDSRCRVPPGARMLAADGARRIVVTGRDAPAAATARLEARGVETLRCPEARPHPASFLPRLRSLGLETLLVEGGAQVHAGLVATREADELFLFLAGRIVGDSMAPAWCGPLDIASLAATPRLRLSPPRAVGADVLIHGLFAPDEALP